MKLEHIDYDDLTSKQIEVYNFQKVASLLADYGFNCMKLSDDWKGADFLEYHKDRNDTLEVQLKSVLTIAKKYSRKELYITFPANGSWYLIKHHELVKLVGSHTPWLDSKTWREKGIYYSPKPSSKLLAALKGHILEVPNQSNQRARARRSRRRFPTLCAGEGRPPFSSKR
jgi:hypothetical protein